MRDEAAGSGVPAPDVPPVEGVAQVEGVALVAGVAVGDAARVGCAARVADAVPAYAQRGAAAAWPDAEPAPHGAFESAAVAVRASCSPADGMLPADVVLAHVVRRLAAALRGVAERPRGVPPGARCLLPPVAAPARN